MKKWLTILVLIGTFVSAQAEPNPWIEPPLTTERNFPVPRPDVVPEIPAAHGSYPAYAIEWWYWVGHLRAAETDEQFGFQSTVFRRAAGPDAGDAEDTAQCGDDQLFMSHAGLSDLTAGRYTHVERIYRGGWQAHSAEGQLDLAAGPIMAMENGQGGFSMTVSYPDDSRLELTLTPTKPMVSFGDRGLSRKGADPAAVSWYWSYSRKAVRGQLWRNGEATAVEGVAWMDHEISSSQLGSNLAGWDWTAIQLDDGTEVKAYRLRENDGGMDPWSACYWIDEAGEVSYVYADRFEWREIDAWTSDDTGLTYPTSVDIVARHPDTDIIRTYRLRPLLDEQEFRGNRAENPYWEGACEVLDENGDRIGLAYLELAGYGGGLAAQLAQ